MMALVKIQFLTLCLVISICIGYAKRSKRIVNGQEASHIPYLASIQRSRGDAACGGAIISSRHVLTVAHCLVDENKVPHPHVFDVLIGTVDVFDNNPGSRYQIVKKTFHVDLSPLDSWKHDIAVLKLDRKIVFNLYRQPIKLPVDKTVVGTVVHFSGWGATQWSSRFQEGDAYPRYLRFGYGKVISNEICQREMPHNTIYPQHICVFSHGDGTICVSDGGSPLINGTHIIGIASFNRFCSKYYPDVYTRISEYIDWIRDAMDD